MWRVASKKNVGKGSDEALTHSVSQTPSALALDVDRPFALLAVSDTAVGSVLPGTRHQSVECATHMMSPRRSLLASSRVHTTLAVPGTMPGDAATPLRT